MTQTIFEKVKEDCEFVVTKGKDVVVDNDGVKELARMLDQGVAAGKFDVDDWGRQSLNPSERTAASADWVFVVDTLNYCFWAPEGEDRFACSYGGEELRGYWTLPACVNRALEEGTPILDYTWLATVTDEQVAHIFRSSNGVAVPLLEKRASSLREIGQGMLRIRARAREDDPDAEPVLSFADVVRAAGGSAAALIETVLCEFPSYRDEAEYEGRRISIMKRAQILVADLWGCFGAQGLGHFHDIGDLTMFADYRVPQIIAYSGAIRYSSDLLDQLASNPHLESGSRFEVEIRAASIVAVERARAIIRAEGKVNVNSVLIDFFLWGEAKARAKELENIPIHKTWGIFY